jgi:P27 family predicted phage terminase small subunit
VRGRKPKPTRIKELAGNPGKRRLNDTEPHPPVPDVVPYAPKFLNDEAKDEWNRMVNILLELGLYTEVDHAALAMYCQEWGRWIIAEKKLRVEGEIITGTLGGKFQNPWRYEANKAQEQMRRMLAEFGMTPSSRSRISVPGARDEPNLAEQLFAMVGGAQVKDGGD